MKCQYWQHHVQPDQGKSKCDQYIKSLPFIVTVNEIPFMI